MMKLNELLERFSTEDACKAFIAQRRWSNGKVACPRCGNEKVYVLKARPFHWLCKSGKESADKETGEVSVCNKRNGYRFSVISHTIFDNTKYSLREWFKVAFFVLNSNKGMSAHQIYRMMGMGSYKTAWYMVHRLRGAMKDGSLQKLLGIVEVDETYIGGKNVNRHWDKKTPWRVSGAASGKVGVIGAISRKGRVVCQMIERADTEALTGFVRKVTSDKVSLVCTNDHKIYDALEVYNRPHAVVKYSEYEWVRGVAHTQSIESFWSLIKRGIMGQYHHVSAKYLPLYLAEFTFRFNNRKNPEIFELFFEGR